MTDRPIDPSTLRDGDIVRAKRGEHGVVEGVFHSYPISSGWGIGSEAEEDGLFAWNDKGWTITDILRPVLVKGYRVEWEGLEGVVGWIAPSGIVQVDRLDKPTILAFARSDNLTRLPAAPEPAPVEVGDWLKSLMDKDSHVVTSVDGDWIGIRWWQSGDIYRVNRRSIEGWTRLDGPPEPPIGSVYVIDGLVRQHTVEGQHEAMGSLIIDSWDLVCWRAGKDRLATLQIVHTLGVE